MLNLFVKKHYDIIFYAPQHFNRTENSENLYFKDLLDVCKENDINFLYFEEPDLYSIQNRSKIAVPFDFICYIVFFFRKFKSSNMQYIELDRKIGTYLKKIFFRNITFDNYITISQSMLSLFYGLNPNAKRFDLQHGTIHSRKKSYLYNGIVSKNLKWNNVHLLLNGSGFKDILVDNDKEKYFNDNTTVIGSSLYDSDDSNRKEINKNVLVSLQFTNDHTITENKIIFKNLRKIIDDNQSFHFYLRNHPRYNKDIDLQPLLINPNVSLLNDNLQLCFAKCSFHLTAYSTVAFEAGLKGIPTCFLDSTFENIFITQYNYPIERYMLSELYHDYSNFSLIIKTWADKFYQPFSKDSFLKAIKYA